MIAGAVIEKPRLNLSLVIIANLFLTVHLLVYLFGSSPEFDPGSRLKLWVSIAAALLFLAISIPLQRVPVALDERWHSAFVSGAALFLLFLALIPVPPFTYTYLAHVHTLLTFALTFWVFYCILFDGHQNVRIGRVWMILAIVTIVVISFVRIYGLSYYPFVDVQDEPWVTAWAVNWVRTGHLGDATLGGLGDAYYAYPSFYWLMGLWIELVGIGLWQERLFSFLLIFPVIGITILVARTWYGRAGALFTGAFLLCSAVLMSAARVRHDIGLTLCLAASLALFVLASKRRSPFFHFLAGFIMLCGMFSHYHAAGLGIAMLVGLYAPRYFVQWRDRSSKRFWLPEMGAWCYVGGAILGTVAVLGIQMLPNDLPAWIWSLNHLSLYSDDSKEFFVSFFGNILNIAFFSIFEFILVAAAVILALRRHSLLDVSLLLILGLGLIALAVMGSGAIYYYILPLVPIYGLLVGRMFLGARQPQMSLSRLQLITCALLLIPLLGVTTGRSLQAVVTAEPLNLPPPPAVQWIRDNIPTQDKVTADMYYYFWLNDYQFSSHLVPEYMYAENIMKYPTLISIWNAVDMDVLVVDPGLQRSYRLYFQPLLATGLIEEKYQVATTIPTESGIVTIYTRR